MTRSSDISSRRRFQWGSLAAVGAGILIVVAAQALDGGTFSALLQGPAALIVFGGTCAATLVSYSPSTVLDALRAAARTFREDVDDLDELSAQLVGLSIRAHRRGLLDLESEVDTLQDPFLRNGLALAVDGVSSEMLREALNVERLAHEAREEVPARVFEAAAGYAPTLGILGAVLGLIRVMEHLATPAALGSGIAMAFVATVYGVGSANLLLLPMAARLRERSAAASRRRDLITETLIDVQQRINPRLVAQKARVFANTLPRVDEIARQMRPSNDLLEDIYA
ncbi:MAG TPA: flagellar motor protein [Vicinamibacterales bacterium]